MDEPFTLVERSAGHHQDGRRMFDEVVKYNSAQTADHDLPYLAALRKAFPELIVTSCPEGNAPLRAFAAAGYATCELDKTTDGYASWRGYVPPARRYDKGFTGESIDFAKYHYRWNDEDFLLFLMGRVQYILKEPREGESILGPSSITDKLVRTIGNFFNDLSNVVWVYDRYWRQDTELFREVQKASWDKVILDEDMKADLTGVAHKFFDSEDVYRDLGVPWKRGLLFYGPPGNGKTVSIKALMHSLCSREKSIPTLYVRSAPYTWDIEDVFRKARQQAPCMLVLEDVETIVTADTRSYFFNEMDGLANNDGMFIVASTNFLDRLDPGLTERPSRFDRKYLFPIPNEHERILYCDFWRRKLKPNKEIVFPKKLLPPMAAVTPNFSFAYLQECFTATLLLIAGKRTDGVSSSSHGTMPYDGDNDDDLDSYELWRVFKEQAEILRRQIGSGEPEYLGLLKCSKHMQLAVDGVSQPNPNPKQPAPHHCLCCRSKGGLARGIPSESAALPGLRESGEVLPALRGGKYQKFTETAFETV